MISGPGAFNALLPLCLANGPRTTPDNIWYSWSVAPEVVLPLIAVPAIYRLLPRRAARPRRADGLLMTGLLLLALALVSPLCRLAASLASAHMTQYVLLLVAAPALLVLGHQQLRNSGRIARRLQDVKAPLAIAYAAITWLAHAPPVYEAALLRPAVHLALLALVLATSLAFWTAVLGLDRLGGIALCFSAMVQTSLLGALITFSQSLWFPVFAGRAFLFGLTPLEDQQLAGLIMWVPMNAIYIAVALALTASWLRAQAGSAQRRVV